MLTLTDIHTYYGESHILQGVSLKVDEGEAVALLGRNGVGKSTTIKSIIGFSPPRRGQILLRDLDITPLPSYRTTRLGVGLAPQGRAIFPTLTVRENITPAAKMPASPQCGTIAGKVGLRSLTMSSYYVILRQQAEEALSL